jgi:magnesium transporter
MITVLEFHAAAEGKAPELRSFRGEEAAARIRRPDKGVVRWIDITGQKAADIEAMGKGFGFHPLALEDCLHFDQRPKLEEYLGADPYLFIVLHGFREAPATAGPEEDSTLVAPGAVHVSCNERRYLIEPLEMHAFLGTSFLVTVHQQPVAALDGVWRRASAEAGLLGRGADYVYYLVADALCDSNFPVLERIGDLLDEIEEVVLQQAEKYHLGQIYQMRKALVTMRRTLSPQRDIMALLSRHGGGACVAPSLAPFFRDIHDHLMRITEAIDSGRDLLGNCVDAYLSAVGQRTNEIMKRLTLLSAVMLPLTFITGFFGMNFEMLPFKSSWVLWAALVLMFLVTPGGMLVWFFRKRWL